MEGLYTDRLNSSVHALESPALIGTLTVVMVYVSFALLWILLSDETIEWLFDISVDDPLVNKTKGWFFVVLPLFFLSLLLRGLSSRSRVEVGAKLRMHQPCWSLVLFYVLILLVTALSIAHTVSHKREQKAAELLAIANLKSRQVTDWVGERRSHAELIRNSPFDTELYHRWFQQGDDVSRKLLLDRLADFSSRSGFSDVILLDSPSRMIWHSGQGGSDIGSLLSSCIDLKGTLTEYKIVRCGPYRNAKGELIMDFMGLMPDTGRGSFPVIILRLDPVDNLYPLLQTWPVPSSSAETLLFKRDDDKVLLLNELRHKSDTALKLSLPLSMEELLSAQVLRDERKLGRIVDGVDYRGIPGMGIALPVAGTDWFLMAKVDSAEVYSQVIGNVVWIALVGMLTIAAVTITAIFIRQRHALVYSLSEQDAQAQKLRALQLLDAIANSSEEMIFAKDLEGRYTLFNRAASQYAGKSANEIIGRDDYAFLPSDHAERLHAIHRQIIALNDVRTLEETLNTAIGKRILLGTGGPLYDVDGQVIGTYGIVRDITDRKKQEQELVQSKRKLRELSAYRDKVREDERAYIARELHDDLGQYLTALRMDANLIQMTFAQDNPELADRLGGMKSLIDHVITEIRSVITRLRPMTLDLGLISATEWLVADYEERTGTKCHLKVSDPDLQLDNDQSTIVFRILQESLTNVARHARADRVDIGIKIVDGVLQLEVRDNGRGFNPAVVRHKKTFGLMGIRERVLIYGGRAKIHSQLGKGVTVRVTLPLVNREAS